MITCPNGVIRMHESESAVCFPSCFRFYVLAQLDVDRRGMVAKICSVIRLVVHKQRQGNMRFGLFVRESFSLDGYAPSHRSLSPSLPRAIRDLCTETLRQWSPFATVRSPHHLSHVTSLHVQKRKRNPPSHEASSCAQARVPCPTLDTRR